MANPLFKKLGLKDGQKVILKGFPEDYFDLLIEVPEIEECENDELADFVHLFEKSRNKLESSFVQVRNQLKQDGMIWISWPKKSSGVESDIDYHVVKKMAVSLGLVDVKVCAIDQTWTATKYVIPLKNRK